MSQSSGSSVREFSAAEILGGFEHEIARHLKYTLGCNQRDFDADYLYRALAVAVRDRLMTNWHQTQDRLERGDQKRVSYLSLIHI